jgi:small subunit ribosomal protein S13
MAIKHLVRIQESDIKGHKSLFYGLTRIRGVGYQFAHALCTISGLDPHVKIGTLAEADLKKVTDIMADPVKAGIPTWMLNRQKDRETGSNLHYFSTKLRLLISDDVKRMKKIKCYKGIRHMFGLPCRGQRTKSNFRPNKGKTSLGAKGGNKKKGRV